MGKTQQPLGKEMIRIASMITAATTYPPLSVAMWLFFRPMRMGIVRRPASISFSMSQTLFNNKNTADGDDGRQSIEKHHPVETGGHGIIGGKGNNSPHGKSSSQFPKGRMGNGQGASGIADHHRCAENAHKQQSHPTCNNK